MKSFNDKVDDVTELLLDLLDMIGMRDIAAYAVKDHVTIEFIVPDE